MKKKFILSLLLFFSTFLVAADSAILRFDQANQLFLKGDYKNAVMLYEEILMNDKLTSTALYYNLGNCYYKLTDFPNAILNYERALKLTPNDPDVLFNLKLANQRVEDKIEAVPELFYYRWFKILYSQMQSGTWGLLTLILLAISTASFFLYLSAGKLVYRKAGFYGSLVMLVFSIGCFMLGWARYQKTFSHQEGIIFSGSVSVKNAPTASGTGLFLLHSGTKVMIHDELEGWVKVKTYDGNEGWVLAEDLEII